MKELSAFYDLVMPELPGITTAMVDLQLVQVARDFCERTSAWRADFDTADLVAGRAEYDLDPSEPQSETVRVLRLTVSDELLWDQNWRQLDRDNETAPKYANEDPPFKVSDDRVSLALIDDEIPTADAADALLVHGAMKPKQGATALPDLFLATYSEALRTGVLTRLMRMAKKPWSDQSLAVAYQADYDRYLNLAATQAQRGNTRAPLRTRLWG